MDKKTMLGQIISYYDGGNKAQFAKRLGKKPQTINTWEARNTFDTELIYAKCEGISGDWLLSGDGDMLRESRFADVCSEYERKLVGLCKELVGIVEKKDSLMGQLVETVKKMD